MRFKKGVNERREDLQKLRDELILSEMVRDGRERFLLFPGEGRKKGYAGIQGDDQMGILDSKGCGKSQLQSEIW